MSGLYSKGLENFPVGTRVVAVKDMDREGQDRGGFNLKAGDVGTVVEVSTSMFLWVQWDREPDYRWDIWPANVRAQSENEQKEAEKKVVESDRLLRIAEGFVYGDRQGDYGHPADDYNRTAKLWTEILGVEVTAQQAILCMIAVKLSRLVNDPTKRDSIIDIAGYAECYDRVSKRLAGTE